MKKYVITLFNFIWAIRWIVILLTGLIIVFIGVHYESMLLIGIGFILLMPLSFLVYHIQEGWSRGPFKPFRDSSVFTYIIIGLILLFSPFLMDIMGIWSLDFTNIRHIDFLVGFALFSVSIVFFGIIQWYGNKKVSGKSVKREINKELTERRG